jgi:hypothetical protein
MIEDPRTPLNALPLSFILRRFPHRMGPDLNFWWKLQYVPTDRAELTVEQEIRVLYFFPSRIVPREKKSIFFYTKTLHVHHQMEDQI